VVTRDDEMLILRRAIAGDESALAELLERHGPTVRGRIAVDFPRRWRGVLSVDDVMQQAYTDAFLAIERFDPRGEGAFLAWLSRLAKNALLDAIDGLTALKRGGDRRRVHADPNQSLVHLCDMVTAMSGTPSRAVAGDEACAALQRAIAELPEAHRQVVTLYDLQGHSAQEVATALGRSQGSIFMLRSRAHRSLAETMGGRSMWH